MDRNIIDDLLQELTASGRLVYPDERAEELIIDTRMRHCAREMEQIEALTKAGDIEALAEFARSQTTHLEGARCLGDVAIHRLCRHSRRNNKQTRNKEDAIKVGKELRKVLNDHGLSYKEQVPLLMEATGRGEDWLSRHGIFRIKK
jgi:hypothetical protein